MRFMLLQQVGGDVWAVYDTVKGDLIRTYNGKYAKDLAGELAAILERGWRSVGEEIEATASMSNVHENVLPSAKRGKILQRKVQGGES